MTNIWDADKFKIARREAGFTAIVAAEFLKITPQYVSMLENGKYMPSNKLVGRMSELYRKPAQYFLAEKNFSEMAK